MQNNIPTLYILEIHYCIDKSNKHSTIFAFLKKKEYKNLKKF